MRNARTTRTAWIMLAVIVALMIPQVSTASAGGSCLRASGYAISGAVKTAAGKAVNGVTITLTGPGGCTNFTTTSKGIYAFYWLRNGTYTVTPSKAGCVFSPVSRTVTISGSSAKANFKATCAP